MKYNIEAMVLAKYMGDTLKEVEEQIHLKYYELSNVLLAKKNDLHKEDVNFKINCGTTVAKLIRCFSPLIIKELGTSLIGTFDKWTFYEDKSLGDNELVIHYQDIAACLTIEGLKERVDQQA